MLRSLAWFLFFLKMPVSSSLRLIVTLSVTASFLIGSAALAQSRQLHFESKYDRFTLVLDGNNQGKVNGKPANLKSFLELLPMLNNPIGNECPNFTTKPDVTVKEGDVTRSIYIERGIISDGENCLNVGGQGLHYFPTHRDFLIGPSTKKIKLGQTLKADFGGKNLFALKREGKAWISPSGELLNWDFIERLENSLADYTISFRVQPEIAKDKPKLILVSDGQKYEFFKLTEVKWAMKVPNQNWLEASNDWSFWLDLDEDLVLDRYRTQIAKLRAFDTSEVEKSKILNQLEGVWSENLRSLYHFMVLSDASLEHRFLAMRRLKRKPSEKSTSVMIQVLNSPAEDELKKEATQILKVQFPKGPIYNPNSTSTEREKVVDFWGTWWKKQKPN